MPDANDAENPKLIVPRARPRELSLSTSGSARHHWGSTPDASDGGQPVTTETDASWPGDGLIEALHVPGPAGPQADELTPVRTVRRLLDARVVRDRRRTATRASMTGELHFGSVLGGRAVQDIWIVPGRGEPGEGQPPLGFHGSTIRFYDAAIGAWRSTWIEPVNGRVRRFIGRPAGDEIILMSDEEDPQLRWRFTDIGPPRSAGAARSPVTAAAPGSSKRRCKPRAARAGERRRVTAQARILCGVRAPSLPVRIAAAKRGMRAAALDATSDPHHT